MTEMLTDICGCVFEVRQGMFVCVKRCPKHMKPKPKRSYRPKAECVRP